jgi:UrcA family protein
MSKYPLALLIAGVVGGAGLVLGSPAIAGSDSGDKLSIVVTSSGLDTHEPGGAAAMLKRIRNAAFRACAYEDAEPVYGCVRGKVNEAVARLNDPMVAAINSGGQDSGR